MDALRFDFFEEVLELVVDIGEEWFEVLQPGFCCDFDHVDIPGEVSGHWHRKFNQSELLEAGVSLDLEHQRIVKDQCRVCQVHVNGNLVNYLEGKPEEGLLRVVVHSERLVRQHLDVVVRLLLKRPFFHCAGPTRWEELILHLLCELKIRCLLQFIRR